MDAVVVVVVDVDKMESGLGVGSGFGYLRPARRKTCCRLVVNRTSGGLEKREGMLRRQTPKETKSGRVNCRCAVRLPEISSAPQQRAGKERSRAF